MKTLILILSLMIATLINCGRTGYVYSQKISNQPATLNNHVFYENEDTSNPKRIYALLVGTNNIVLRQFDDEKLNISSNYLVILPGKHKATVSYSNYNEKSTSFKDVLFEVKEHQTVFICANRDFDNWKPSAIIIDNFFPQLQVGSPPCN
jgi:hypothetical protein